MHHRASPNHPLTRQTHTDTDIYTLHHIATKDITTFTTTITTMASADVASPSDVTPAFDVPRIAAFLQITPQTVEAVSAIEGVVVANVLTALTEKAREHAELVADKLKADVELEQK